MVKSKRLGFGAAAALIALSAVVLAQTGGQPKAGGLVPTQIDPSIGTMHLTTKIGSFKLLDGTGRVEVSFTGTMLISQLKGTIVPTGNLKKEYEARDRVVYHGTGKVVIEGDFRGIQWFGTNMTGVWTGRGVARITGEFDQNLETGYYWYGKDPNRKIPWSMYSLTIMNPEQTAGGTGVPVERKPGGGG
ncbi:MAG TPA: hypothetical protein PLX06_10695 [Fimbriimonadaceae bacterium]|nr:hypothetical protein [Fimbriimonadaceae bacterium]